jgi:hypothetical protein
MANQAQPAFTPGQPVAPIEPPWQAKNPPEESKFVGLKIFQRSPLNARIINGV